MATIREILASGFKIPFVRLTTSRLPSDVEATLPAALRVGQPGGVAALSPAGLPVSDKGVPAAVIGTTTGTAADAGAVAQSFQTVQAAVQGATQAASTAGGNATAAAAAATQATTAANQATAAAVNKVSTSTDASRVPEVRWYPTKALGDAAALNLADGTWVNITAAT